MVRNVKGKNKKVYTVGLALLLASAMIMLLFVGPAMATNDDSITRLSGANRWATSAKVALEAYPKGSDDVIIARGDDAGGWADGLAGGYLAGLLNAPILLTAPGALDDTVIDAIGTLEAKKAYILGGTVAVSAEVEAELIGLGLDVERIAGANREETAAQIAGMEAGNDIDALMIMPEEKTAFIVQGRAPADSMVAGAAAFAKGYPILLVNKDSVPEVTETAIVDLEITNLIIVGGTAVVSQAVEDLLDEIEGVVTVTRLSGADREATSVVFAEDQFTDSVDFSIVNGRQGLADAVGASVFGNPILYVRTDAIPAGVGGYLVDNVICESMIYIFGGAGVVSAAVAAELEAIKDAAVCEYTVTFVEQNSLEGVVIQVYSDEDRTDEVGDALTTDDNGEATIDLEDGDYWYNATLVGYVDLEDGFTVAGADKTVEFTLVAEVVEYTVTFNEEKDEEGVSIQVYSDEARTVEVGDALTTDDSGEATIDLEDGDYWFTASLSDYFDYEGSFEVDGAAITVNFEMQKLELVQTKSAKDNNPTVTASFDTQPQEGSLLIAFSGNRTSTSAPATDTMAGWNKIGDGIATGGQNRNLHGWWKVAESGESQDVSVTWDTSSNHSWVVIQEFHGASNYDLVAHGTGVSIDENTSMTFPDPTLSAGGNDNILAVAGMMLRAGSAGDYEPSFDNVSLGDVFYDAIFDNDEGARMEAATAFTWTQDGSDVDWQTTATFEDACWSAGILGLFTFDPVAP